MFIVDSLPRGLRIRLKCLVESSIILQFSLLLTLIVVCLFSSPSSFGSLSPFLFPPAARFPHSFSPPQVSLAFGDSFPPNFLKRISLPIFHYRPQDLRRLAKLFFSIFFVLQGPLSQPFLSLFLPSRRPSRRFPVGSAYRCFLIKFSPSVRIFASPLVMRLLLNPRICESPRRPVYIFG